MKAAALRELHIKKCLYWIESLNYAGIFLDDFLLFGSLAIPNIFNFILA